MIRNSRILRLSTFVLALVMLVAIVSIAIPAVSYAAAQQPIVAFVVTAPAQQIPDPNSFVPAILQVALIVLVAQGVKSLGKVLGGKDENGNYKFDLQGREAGIAYIVVGLVVYGVGIGVTMLPPEAATQVKAFLGVAATLLAGSGLYSMTAAFRV